MALAAAIALAAVFGVAAVAKLTDRDGLRRTMVDFGVPTRAAVPLGRLLVMGEFVIALALVVRPSARDGALGALVLLIVFSGVIALNVSRGRAPACHCFGRLHAAPVGWSTVARNVLLATLAGFVAAGGHLPWLFAGLAAIVSALWITLWAKQGGKVRPGMPAPDFSLPDEAGRTWTMRDLLVGGRPLLLVFSDRACGACSSLLPQVARWQQDHDERVTIAVVSGGARPVPLVGAGEAGLRRLLADPDRHVLAAYGVTATPSAVLIDAERIIAAVPAVGAAEISDLVSKALQPLDRSTIARRAVLFASATLVPALASACAVGRGVSGITPSKRPPKQLAAGRGWLCDQRYALCTSAACEPSPNDPGIVICHCVVQDGYSFGFASCAERAPAQDRLVSTFSVQNTTSRTHTMTCTTRARWANCLDVVCEIDPHNPRQALCRCQSVESENFLTFGGNCDTKTCTTVIWSAATKQLPGVAEYKSAMKSIGHPVTFPESCPSGSPQR
ncbi:MauE/DoxX family redox-associated membrane protein [Streptomyces sp. NBC_00996]|uniref:MauE/DoxX family redox-associated membrane protein n=1 Tax=Streptomyces sp. NBC_00996 TaxID=2903710 RepID=UPI0038661320|nr:redoxin domain-containing protein [Streptomyces sp. NBC_00996]